MNPIKPGKFIVLEGGEGAGKTSQLEILKQRLNDTSAIFTRQPGGTFLGVEIRKLLLLSGIAEIEPRTELLLYAADRAQHVERCIRPALDSGITVFCDRYADSTMAYQGYGRGIDKDLVAQINRIATAGVNPDLTIWIDTPPEIGLERAGRRGKSDRIESAGLGFHRAVRIGFTEMAQSNPSYRWIDGTLDVDNVSNLIWEQVKELLNK